MMNSDPAILHAVYLAFARYVVWLRRERGETMQGQGSGVRRLVRMLRGVKQPAPSGSPAGVVSEGEQQALPEPM